MKVFALILPVSLVLVSACNPIPTGRITHTTYGEDGSSKTVALSEYFEAGKELQDGDVFVHLVITLGDERLPEEYDSPLSLGDRLIQDRIDMAEEINVVNRSEKPVKIDQLDLRMYSDWESLLEEPRIIEPGAYFQSEGYYSTTSVFRAPRERKVRIGIDGTTEVFTFEERRVPVRALKRQGSSH